MFYHVVESKEANKPTLAKIHDIGFTNTLIVSGISELEEESEV